MGAMLAAGGLINGGALLGMLSNTHTDTHARTHTRLFSLLSQREQRDTQVASGRFVCVNVARVSPAKQATDRLSSDLLQLVIVQMCVRACD